MEHIIRRTQDGLIQIVPDSARARQQLMTQFDLIPSVDGTVFLTPQDDVDEIQVMDLVDWLKASMQKAGMTVHYRLN